MSRDLLPHNADAWMRTTASSTFHRAAQRPDFKGFAGALACLFLYAVLLVFVAALLFATLPGVTS